MNPSPTQYNTICLKWFKFQSTTQNIQDASDVEAFLLLTMRSYSLSHQPRPYDQSASHQPRSPGQSAMARELINADTEARAASYGPDDLGRDGTAAAPYLDRF